MIDKEIIYLCALKYSLGRRTYITGLVADFLMGETLSKVCRDKMIRNIVECDDLGHDCDKEEWNKLLKHLKK